MSKYQKGKESGHARLAVTLLRWALLTREKKRLGHCFSLSYCGPLVCINTYIRIFGIKIQFTFKRYELVRMRGIFVYQRV